MPTKSAIHKELASNLEPIRTDTRSVSPRDFTTPYRVGTSEPSPATIKKSKPGPKAGAPKKVVSFNLEKKLYHKLNKLAKAKQRSNSFVVQVILEEALKKDNLPL